MVLEQLGLIGNIIVLIVSLGVLIKSSSLTINNSVNLASVTGLGKTKVGFILVAFSTSLPELFVATFAILDQGTVGISLGNILGSNIMNICLILGIGFLLMAIKYPESAGFFTKMTRDEVGNLNFGVFVASIVPLLLLYFGYATQIMGFILIGLFIYNMYDLVRKRETVQQISDTAEKSERKKYLIKAVFGIFGVVTSSFFIIESASFLALIAGIPPIIIGATVVAFGTSIPELVTSVDSIRKGFIDLALGNVIGSCFINITLVLGFTFIFAPLNVDVSAFSDLILFSLIANIVLGYIIQNSSIGKREGITLLLIYAIFLVVSFGQG
ncbi:MAG: sodium:calcium antiporter [Candidatus Bathyarchaeota archaeon]|nr:sodium:calcium antiporter [Candidatus Bathyarchaeum tardum]WGM88815.1 MAG: sodium:calcium antiporter [Candidatus Bathyarchaeum tardum]WNZ28940.1 MAG: sodium:calcium antiporter [Candidatus Bathyarchaeota archaeon]